MGRPRAADYEEKRAELLRVCAELFAEHGYTRTSITDIAAACGISKALIYHYYPSKEQLLVDILRRHLTRLRDAVEAARAEAPEGARLRAVVGALLEAYRDTDALHKIHVNELARLPQAPQAELRRVERALVAVFSEALAAATPGLAGSPLLTPVTMSLLGMLNWHRMWFRPGGPMSREDYAELATRLILAGARRAVTAEGRAGAPED